MKTSLLFFNALILTFVTRGQDVVICTFGRQAVYGNIANPLSIGSFGLTESQLILKTDNGLIEKSGKNYLWTPTHINLSPAHIYCYKTNNKGGDTVLLCEKQFDVVTIGYPDVRWSQSEIHSGLPRWMHLEKLYLSYSGPRDLSYLKLDSLSKILSFEISIKDSSLQVDTILKSNGEYFPKEFNSIIGLCRPKTEVRFFNIKIWADWETPKEYLYDDYLKLFKKPMFFIL